MPVTKYIYDGDAVLQEADGAGVTQVTYTRTGPGYGDLLSSFDGTTTRYYEPDGLGSTDALSDDAGAVTDRWAYRAFGANVHVTGSDPTPFTWVGRQGYYYDNEKVLYFLGTRYFDQITAAFLTINTFGVPGATRNLYQYVGNSPLNLIIPSGLLPVPASYVSNGSEQRYSAMLMQQKLGLRQSRRVDSGVHGFGANLPTSSFRLFMFCGCQQTEEQEGPASGGTPKYKPRTDEECCRDAMYERLDNGDWGGVVCCDGRKVACDWSPYARDPVAIPEGAWHICILKHERAHFGHIADCPVAAPYLKRPPFWRQWNQAQLECDAYKAQLGCLADFIAICEFLGTEARKASCRKEFLRHNNLLRRNANILYNCQFVLFPPDVLN